MQRLNIISGHLRSQASTQLLTCDQTSTLRFKGPRNLKLSTLEIHADQGLDAQPDVAPAIRVATTFQQPNSEQLVYSREATPTRTRVEAVLTAIGGGHAVTYGSGQAASAAVLFHIRPRRVLMDCGYHASRLLFELEQQKLQQNKQPGESAPLEVIHLKGRSLKELAGQKFDLVFLETPSNPHLEVKDIHEFSKFAKAAGAVLVVDATVSSPLGCNPFEYGADIVMHSSTKYLGGHSDLLGGVLLCADERRAAALRHHRVFLGSIMGNLESFLLLRSLRTFSLRHKQQSATACKVAYYLSKHPKVTRVWHPSLESHPSHALAKSQLKVMPALLSFALANKEQAQAVLSHFQLLTPATSLGGVESLIDWRYKYDQSIEPGLIRVSIGLEDADDLLWDFEQALSRI